jgi:hypothetical protein
LLLVLASAIILRFEIHGNHDHILLSQIRDYPNMEVQVSELISLRNRVAQLYPQRLGSLFVASYDSQGYGGIMRPRLHTGFNTLCLSSHNSSLYIQLLTATDLVIYRVSQEECARLQEGVPYVKIYRYNPKHLCPKLNG